jgi:hypothetical protein
MGCGCNSGGGMQTGGGNCSGPLAGQQQTGGGGSGFSDIEPLHQPPIYGGGTRRRKHTRRHRRNGTRKMRVYGRKRACKCPGGCNRSTCPCRTGKRSCCTKRCRCLGARA